jgi:hypothetical protein
MRSLILPGATLALALCGSIAHADSHDSLGDFMGPREIAVGEAMRGGATGASAIGENPAGLPLNRELVFEGGYGYRPGDQASLVSVSACDSTAGMPGCFFYDYAGSTPDLDGVSMHRTQHVGGLALGRMLTPRIFFGSTMKYFHVDSDVMTDPKSSGFNWDLGLLVKLTDLVNIGVAGYNLYGAESIEFPRAVGGGMQAHPLPALAVSFDMRWRLADGTDQGARYGGGLEYFMSGKGGQSGYPIRLGALHDNSLGATYVSGGLGIKGMQYGVDVALRREVSGGAETMVIASMRFFGPQMSAPNPQ